MEVIRFIYIAGYVLSSAGILFILFPRIVMGINALANKFIGDLDKGVMKHERVVGFAMLILSILLLLIASIFKARIFTG